MTNSVIIVGLLIAVFGAGIWAFRPPTGTGKIEIKFFGLEASLDVPALGVMMIGVVLVLVGTKLGTVPEPTPPSTAAPTASPIPAPSNSPPAPPPVPVKNEVEEVGSSVVVSHNNKATVDFYCPDGYTPKGIDVRADRVLAKFDMPIENHTRIYFFNWGTDPASDTTARYVMICVK